MPSLTVSQLVAEALALRQSHPAAPARDLLDLVLAGRDASRLEFGALAEPPEPFALLVAEAIDADTMDPRDWPAFTGRNAPEHVRSVGLKLWRDEVWPKFLARYTRA